MTPTCQATIVAENKMQKNKTMWPNVKTQLGIDK